MTNNKQEYISVSSLNRYLYLTFQADPLLQQVFVEAELSNVKKSGQHYYFSLKDSESEIGAMYFYPANLSLTFVPKDGMKVQVSGKVQIYQKRGTYSINVTSMNEVGVGILYQNYLELKAKLEKEGLFDEKVKKPIPDYAEHVGIITSPTGEAINDIVSTFNRRFPLAKLTLFPALVQGLDAPKDLIRALDLAYKDNTIDVLIIGRGGGSYEDLNCFNDEALARKLFVAPFPTVSAVGHEGDYTICDFVCSFRAPTPTGAAMRLTKLKDDVLNDLISFNKRLVNGIKQSLINNWNRYNTLNESYGLSKFDEIILKKEQNYNNLVDRLSLLTPENIAENLNNEILHLQKRLDLGMSNILGHQEKTFDNYNNRLRVELVNNIIEKYEVEFNNLVEKSTLLNPLNIIKKGYSIVYKDNDIVYNVSSLNKDDEIKIRFSDGQATATVNKIEKE